MHALRPLLGITVALAAALSCTAILKPDDSVERCGSADDCSSTGDNRYEPRCVFDEDAEGIDPTKVEKICVAAYTTIGCGPDANQMTADELVEDCGSFGVCDTPDTLGCEQVNGCMVGTVNQYGVCDDGSGTHPLVGALYISDAANNLDGADIYDQFCRGFFCDEDFVCVENTCVKCDPSLAYGMGGCGEVWRNGARSFIYDESTWSDDSCADASFDGVVFGMCP